MRRLLPVFLFLAGCLADTSTIPRGAKAPGAGPSECIDTHVHLDGRYRSGETLLTDYEGAAATALEAMDRLGIRVSLVMPPPFTPEHPNRYDYPDLARVARAHPDRLRFLGGGWSLNPVIQESVRSGTVTEETRRGFEAKALEILKAGAVGFGELTAEHLSFYGRHPYEAAPPDHPLFRLLADVAARHGVPIDLHMEAVPRDMSLPERFLSPPNPGVLRENVAAFERLLVHNRQARIVWSHAGWDNTGHRTVDLMRRLLAAHSNLYLSVKVAPSGVVRSRPLDASGAIRPEWLDLLRAFPERVVIGSDQFYGSPRVARVRPWSAGGARAFLDGLPPDLARRVGQDNALRIYGLGRARARPAGAGGVPDVHGPVRAWRLRPSPTTVSTHAPARGATSDAVPNVRSSSTPTS